MDEQVDFSVVAFGETERAEFPLILIFGRESNGSNTVVPGISIYDETVSSGSSFWNRAITFLKRSANSPGNLRDVCIKRNTGPVLFTNIFPHPIPNSVKNKDLIRSSISLETINEHISSVFNLDVVKRVRVVIFSTGPAAHFIAPKDIVKSYCKNMGIGFIEVPYFANPRVTNMALDGSIVSAEKSSIKEVVEEYFRKT